MAQTPDVVGPSGFVIEKNLAAIIEHLQSRHILFRFASAYDPLEKNSWRESETRYHNGIAIDFPNESVLSIQTHHLVKRNSFAETCLGGDDPPPGYPQHMRGEPERWNDMTELAKYIDAFSEKM